MSFATFLEGRNFTIYSLVPGAVGAVKDFLQARGIPYVSNSLSPWGYARASKKFLNTYHIVIVDDPNKLHSTASAMFKRMSFLERWKTDFYTYYLCPWLGNFVSTEVRFILYSELKDYIGEFEQYRYEESAPLFDISEDVQEWNRIVNYGSRVHITDWQDCIIRQSLV